MDYTTPMNTASWQSWFEGIWAHREETLYRAYFGDLGKSIYPLTAAAFQAIGLADPDPRFLHHGVFECPPTDRHPDWIYVSSGMSNAWGESPETADPKGYSGLGCEFTLHTASPQPWAIQLLHWLMAVQLGVACGRLEGGLVHRHDRIAIGPGIPTQNGPGLITHLQVLAPDDSGFSGSAVEPLCYPSEFSLATGRVEMLLLVGITQRESHFASTQGVEGLVTLLRHQNIFPQTLPARQHIV